MNTTELMIKVKEMLNSEGFKTKAEDWNNPNDYSYRGRAWKGDRLEYRVEHSPWGDVKMLWGDELAFSVVSRHNGTDENVSVDVCTVRWERSSGRVISKERVNIYMSEKQIRNRVYKMVARYDEM